MIEIAEMEKQLWVSLPKKEEINDEITERARIQRAQYQKQLAAANATQQIRKTVEIQQRPQPVPAPQPKQLPPDWTSVQGQFGWAEIDKCTIPYIIRSGVKYIAERMATVKLFLEYKRLYKDDILGDDVLKVQLTPAEAELLNEINFKHCDGFYGKPSFTPKDYMISVEDIGEMNAFYKFVYKYFVEKDTSKRQRCGFIKISGQNCVPYVFINNQEYVPLFYFEGDCEYLEETALPVCGWDLTYLKFSCRVQGIRKELYDKDSIRVVKLEVVKKYFLPGTQFEEYWLKDNPKLFTELSMMIFKNLPLARTYSNIQNNRNNYFQSTRPVAPPANPPTRSYQTQTLSSTSASRPHAPQNIPAGLTFCRIPEITCSDSQIPYTFSSIQIENRWLHACINMGAFNYGNLLISLEEVANSLFVVHVNKVVYAVSAMGLLTYLPNSKQAKMLEGVGIKNTQGLIQMKVFVENLPQLRYILSST